MAKKSQPVPPPYGKYANFLASHYNLSEVVLDFGQVTPGSNLVELHTRIVTSPQRLMDFHQQIKAVLQDIGTKAKKAAEEGKEGNGGAHR